MQEKDKPKSNPKSDGESDMCVLRIRSPRSPEVKEIKCRKDSKVKDVANEASKEFGYAPGNPTFIDKGNVKLDREQTLNEAQVNDLDELVIADSGGGV